MNKILTLNCGSSSIKYRLFDRNFNTIMEGLIEKIGEKGTQLVHTKGDDTLKRAAEVKNHRQAVELMLKMLHDREWGAIKKVTEISVVGHRVVHGGQLTKPGLVSNAVLRYLRSFELLAPLHNPHNITGIEEAKRAMPTVPQVMVFDTEFHQNMPRKAYMYGLPYHFFDKYAIRRYGFHGISFRYVSGRAAKMLKKRNPKLIACHLGAGSSIAAIKEGRSVDTTMGLTPLEGVMMATRTGDIDPSAVQYLVKKYKFDYDELFDIMNKNSGLLGVSGVSKDVRIIEARAKKGNERCRLALEMFCYRVAKYIGAYAVVLGNVDAVVFTAGIGENSASMRKEICSYLRILGVRLDSGRNRKAVKKEMEISAKDSRIRVLVIPTDEELMIARQAASVIEG
jgi:acetate kinase